MWKFCRLFTCGGSDRVCMRILNLFLISSAFSFLHHLLDAGDGLKRHKSIAVR